jgi:hypothetical protein
MGIIYFPRLCQRGITFFLSWFTENRRHVFKNKTMWNIPKNVFLFLNTISVISLMFIRSIKALVSVIVVVE